MRFELRYRTRFGYPASVRESQNELRACPASDDRQQLLQHRVTITPDARVVSYRDYWGTLVETFGVRLPHDRLEITSESVVETQRPAPLASSAPREALADPGFRDRHHEYLQPSAHASWSDAVATVARERAELAGGDVADLALSLHRTIGQSFEYVTGATQIGTSVDDVLADRRGVCQDFAHLVIAMARSVGLPARYVSGYLFTADERSGAAPDAQEVEVETHAWVEVAVPGHGWWGLDPTNQQEVGARHITIGHGRDYDDVAPLRGTYVGPDASALDVGVRIRRQQADAQQ